MLLVFQTTSTSSCKMKMLAFIIVTVLLDQVVSDDPTTCTTKYGLELDHLGRTSCDDIYEKNPASHYKSGLYVIKTNKVQLVYCDMSLECGSHKGGWMRIADLNSSRDNCPPGWINNQGYQGRIQGGALGAEAPPPPPPPPPFIFRLYLINMLSIVMKFCLSIII